MCGTDESVVAAVGPGTALRARVRSGATPPSATRPHGLHRPREPAPALIAPLRRLGREGAVRFDRPFPAVPRTAILATVKPHSACLRASCSCYIQPSLVRRHHAAPSAYPIHGEPHDIGEFGLNRQ